jgi:hypothetical protein
MKKFIFATSSEGVHSKLIIFACRPLKSKYGFESSCKKSTKPKGISMSL